MANLPAMRSRRKWLILLAGVVLISAVLTLLSRNREPTYKGRRLSEWMRLRATISPPPGQTEEAADAIRHIGTNALPLLLALIDDPSPGWWRRGRALSQRLPDWITGSHAAHWLRQHHRVILGPEDARSLAEILGPVAAPAVPDLVRRLSTTNWHGRRDLATRALACAGPEAIAKSAAPCIAMLLIDSDLAVRTAATNALTRIAPEVLTNAPPR